jgi:hypothetical protein
LFVASEIGLFTGLAQGPATLQPLQQIVGGLIEPVYQGLDDNHHCYVNEEGLLNDPQYFFMFRDGHQPLAGNGGILSSTHDGGEASCTLPFDWVKERVTFMRQWCRAHAADHRLGFAAFAEIEVRSRLRAGGSRIRTIGPPLRMGDSVLGARVIKPATGVRSYQSRRHFSA